MKKYLIFLMMAAMLAFTACSDDDNDVEPIVGTWILQSVTPNTLFNPQDCPSDSVVRILGGNSLTASLYFQQNNCDLITGDGSWEKTGTSSYTFVFPEVGEVQGTATFPGEDRMIFTTENDLIFTFQLQL